MNDDRIKRMAMSISTISSHPRALSAAVQGGGSQRHPPTYMGVTGIKGGVRGVRGVRGV